MKREHILIPKPNSTFLSIECENCNEKKIAYSHSNSDIICDKCNSILLEKTGAKAKIHCRIVETFT